MRESRAPFISSYAKRGYAMPSTKLNKWGNSQGVLIPKQLCERAGFRVGDTVEMTVNNRTGKIEISPQKATMVSR